MQMILAVTGITANEWPEKKLRILSYASSLKFISETCTDRKKERGGDFWEGHTL